MKKLLRALLVLFCLVVGSVLLTVLWERNPDKFPTFPSSWAVWLSANSNLPKDDLSILVGISFSFLFLALLAGMTTFVYRYFGKR